MKLCIKIAQGMPNDPRRGAQKNLPGFPFKGDFYFDKKSDLGFLWYENLNRPKCPEKMNKISMFSVICVKCCFLILFVKLL